MDENKRVEIISITNGKVVMLVPHLNLRRVWPQKGSRLSLRYGDLVEAIYEPGVERLFTEGMLYIEDMAVKVELGLEPAEAKEPTNIIVLNNAQKAHQLNKATLDEFKKTLDKLPADQIMDLAYYAIELKITDMAKANVLKEKTNIDIMKAIAFQVEEEKNK